MCSTCISFRLYIFFTTNFPALEHVQFCYIPLPTPVYFPPKSVPKMSYLLQNNLVSDQAMRLRTPMINWSSDSETMVSLLIVP
jgi:hypothetical protein